MRKTRIYYAQMDEFWRKEEKFRYLEKLEYVGNVDWQEVKSDRKYTWLTEGSEDTWREPPYLFNRYTAGHSTPSRLLDDQPTKPLPWWVIVYPLFPQLGLRSGFAALVSLDTLR